MSDKLKFTPGLWYTEEGLTASGTIKVRTDKEIVASVRPYENGQSNAHLIAAAPELYEALREIIRCDDATWKAEGRFLIGDRIGRIAREALDKAEGK